MLILIFLIVMSLLQILTAPTRQKCAAKTIHAAGELARNPNDPRRTRSQFKSALCMKDPMFAEKLYLMVESDTQTYE